MTQGLAIVDPVTIAPAVFADFQETFVLQVADDLLHSPLRDTNLHGYIPESRIAITRKANHHVTMVAEKGPIAHYLSPAKRQLESGYPLPKADTMNDISCLAILQ